MAELVARKNIRLRNYDYSDDGYYFVTICSGNRENIFIDNTVGAALVSARNHICNRKDTKLSRIGQIIDNQWNNIPSQYPHVQLDQYVIMPNHLHGILAINKRAQTSSAPTISQIIRSFKSKSTMAYLNYLKQNDVKFPAKIWQRSFYDHVIRNERSLQAIREYIAHNPEKWEQDIENISNP